MTRALTIATLVLLAIFFIFGFLPRLLQARKNAHQAQKLELPEVSVMLCKPQDKPVPLVLPSVTQANHVTPIWARANGYINKLLVDIGDTVTEGQLLALLDTPELDQQYNQALFEYESAKVRRDLAKVNAQRAKFAYEENVGAISKLDRDQFIANYNAAIEDVRAAKANMNHYKDLMEYKNIIAPFDGIIIQRNVDIGSLVTQGSSNSPQQLFTIAATDIIRVFVSVPQIFFRSISNGIEGITKIREFINKSFKSVVARYANALDQTAHTMLTELHIDNKNGELVPGLYAEVTFMVQSATPYFIVPTPAVIIRAGDPKVAILDEHNIAHLKTVKIGHDYGKAMEIIEGIQANDRLVINPTEKIREGVSCDVSEVQQNDKYYFPGIY